MYANPNTPTMCPVLALSRYLLANPDVLQSNGKLFPGDNQYGRFMHVFNKAIETNKEVFATFGVMPGDMGSHSCRKGAISLVAAGCTVSPPMSAICLRASWSMGPVKDRYIHYEKAGDQYVGRCATGVSSLSKQFAASPAYWDFTDQPQCSEKEVDKVIHDNFARPSEISENSFNVVRNLFASICYHYTFLNTNLHPLDKLRSSPMFIAAGSTDIQQYAQVRFPWNATSYTP